MAFPSLAVDLDDIYAPWDALHSEDANFIELVNFQNQTIDNPLDVSTEVVNEDVCLSKHSEKDTTRQADKFLLQSAVGKSGPYNPMIMVTGDCYSELDHELTFDTDQCQYGNYVRDGRTKRKQNQLFSEIQPPYENNIISKSSPQAILVPDSSVSGSGKRGPPGGDPNSKNAIAARDNRLKKKKYIADLENTVKQLKSENLKLRQESSMTKKSLTCLQQEVSYLKGVIANQTTLSALLKSVSKTPGIKLSSSLGQPSADLLENKLSINSELSSEASPSNGTRTKNCFGKTKTEFSHYQNFKMCTRQATITKQFDSNKKTFAGIQCQQSFKPNAKKRVRNTRQEICSINIEDSETNSETEVDIEDDFSEELSNKDSINSSEELPSGICFHVNGSKVSLEMCSHCNSSALLDHTYVK